MASKKKQQKSWLYTFSFCLALLMLSLIGGYFVQSFIEIRKVGPVSVAIERLKQGDLPAQANKPPEHLPGVL